MFVYVEKRLRKEYTDVVNEDANIVFSDAKVVN